jgi:hypothetical protein
MVVGFGEVLFPVGVMLDQPFGIVIEPRMPTEVRNQTGGIRNPA